MAPTKPTKLLPRTRQGQASERRDLWRRPRCADAAAWKDGSPRRAGLQRWPNVPTVAQRTLIREGGGQLAFLQTGIGPNEYTDLREFLMSE